MKSAHFSSLLVLAILLLPAAAYAKDRVNMASELTDVRAALTDWSAAVESGDVDNIMRLYDKNAVMISTFKRDPMTTRSEILSYFKRVVTNPDIKVTIDDSHPRVFGTMAVNSGRYTLSYTQDGEPVSVPARFSFTYVLENGKWMIVDMHSSRVPLPDEKK